MYTLNKFKLLVFVQQLLIVSAKGGRYQLIFTHLNCTYNDQFVSKIHCRIDEPNPSMFDMSISYRRDMGKDYVVNFRMDMVRPGRKPANVMLFDVKVCKFFAKHRDNRFVEGVRKGFANFGNYSAPCPLKKLVTYGLYNFTVDVAQFPLLPETATLTTLIYRFQKNEVFRMVVGAKLELRKKQA